MNALKVKFDDKFGKLEIAQKFVRAQYPNGDGTYNEFSGTVWTTHVSGGYRSCDCRYCESWQGECTNPADDVLRSKTCLPHCVSGCSFFKLSNKFKPSEQPTLF